ncbi:hypothetical protein CO172_03445 [Candidatus Uhrbacteria bacterium CG_4_9_14_3_um_filter_36_7]|uniref:Type IV secretion system coupling protein TraD DNA-binding domain-containing protein n=1 Tax=Candidatus Uhrbacteria bacterium CG_4_9_14_3_um_filter_36_7 TaxID=1975033 RepID=A0A2M7XG86_9BACT|nr:MAG: hypothetical protein CO172_03445 [Candidatus Uhrbacteria bacterium CG_4_9_14_3_um_filter_36_7]
MPAYADHDHENDVIYFGRTNYRNAMRKFGIRTDDRRRHVYVIGKTGMGKTTLLENMILSDIYLGHGCAYVDPHGDTAEKLIDYIPEWRLEDVVYLNPADLDYPVGFNILESVDSSKRHVVASGLMGVFKKIWPDVWSARMEHILNNCILTLLENPGNSLLGVNRILVDKDFRRKMIAGVQDPVVKAFWITEFEQWDPKFQREAIAPIQNKVGQFLSTALVRNIVAQQKSTIYAREIMDQNKIFIVNLSKGRIGEDAMALLGGMLTTQMQLAAMERVDVPEVERSDFYLFIDEFQNFATESFANILSEARKYRLALIMAHQYIDQLDEKVRSAVFGNVGTIITFRVGSPDAIFLETEFTPRFTQEDLVNLAKFQIYLRLMINGVASDPFSALTLPPIAQRTNSTQDVIQSSRALYARPREVVERAILAWSEMGGESAGLEDTFKKIDEEKKDRKKARRPQFEYNCTRCNTLINLPVELDRSRPIYCEECIKIIREERKKPKYESKSSDKRDSFVPKQETLPTITEGQIMAHEIKQEVGLSALIGSKHLEDQKKQPPTSVISNPQPPLIPKNSIPSTIDINTPPVVSQIISPKSNETVENEASSVEKKRRRRRRKKTNQTIDSGSVNSSENRPLPPVSSSPNLGSNNNEGEKIFPW